MLPPNDPWIELILLGSLSGQFQCLCPASAIRAASSAPPAGAERLFGYSSEEALDNHITMLFPPEHVDEEPMIIERIRRGERVESFETVRRRKDGTDIPVSLTISPVRDSIGRIVGASKIARDITAAKESEQRIRMLMREVNHRVKNEYAVILSMIRETNNRSESPDIFEKRVRERIMALSRSHDLLVSATVADLILDQAKLLGREDAIALHGPPLVLTPNAVQYLGSLSMNSVPIPPNTECCRATGARFRGPI